MTGALASIATPVKYWDSGIMTFITSQQGVVYESGLGLAKVAASIQEYNLSPEWTPIK